MKSLIALAIVSCSTIASAGKIYPSINAGESGSPIGVQVHAYALLKNEKPSHNLQLMYQFRIYGNDGKPGQVLGDTKQPTRAYRVNATQSRSGEDLQLQATFDVVRGQISHAKGLPKVAKDTTIFVAVEAQVYDSAARKYLTPSVTPPLMLAARVTRFGRVYRLEHFANWLQKTITRGGNDRDAIAVFQAMHKVLPVYRHHLLSTFESLLESKSVKAETKVALIKAMPANWLDEKSNLPSVFETLQKSSDPGIASAAAEKMKSKRRK